MILEKIDERRILVALTREDMEILTLTLKQLSRKNEYSRKIIKWLLLKSELEIGLYIDNRRIVIEAMPQENGYFVLITLVSKKAAGRKIYKIKEKEKTYLFEFNSARELLDAIEILYKKKICSLKNTVISCKNKYYIIFYAKGALPFNLQATLTEFGSHLGDSFILSARAIELGEILAQGDAVNTIGADLKK